LFHRGTFLAVENAQNFYTEKYSGLEILQNLTRWFLVR